MAARSMNKKLPLIVVVGPTASGKTSLAIDLAEQFNGEIICADSRTVYRGMDIGTAKPTADERVRVPHWGLDLVNPGERFTAADFKKYTDQKIKEIRSRGHVPFLVGGTGLYVDAVVFDYQFGMDADIELRKKLATRTIEQLQRYCDDNNVVLPENRNNKRYIIHAIEQKSISTTRKRDPDDSTIIVGIATYKDMLRVRIAERTEQLFDDGVVDEAIMLGKKYGWKTEAMTGNIYGLVHLYLQNKINAEELREKNTTLDWRLAKRQLTWLRRNPHIKWLALDEAKEYLSGLLAKAI